MSGSPPAERQRSPRRLPPGADVAPPAPRLNLLVLVGPTGTGKTAVALRVARRIEAEIVGCDALQVYRGFDVATAKPSEEERLTVPHHLVDAIDPRRDFTMADYVRLAEARIAEIAGRGRVPMVVGGTGLYLRALLRGVVPAPARDERLRARLRRLGERHGAPALHRRLRGIDPETAARLPQRDTQRIVRALEVAFAGGGTWSQRLREQGSWAAGRERYRALKFVLEAPRPWLVERLDRRAGAFFEGGLVEEVRGLLASGVPATANAFKAIGYREVLRAVERGEDPSATVEAIRVSTRRYAKRQRTWFRAEPGLRPLDATVGVPALADEIEVRWNAFVAGDP